MNILQSGIPNIILSAGADTSSISAFFNEHLNIDFVMGAVVASLVFICIIIFLSRKDKQENTTPVMNQGNIQNAVTEDLMNDTQLVAVITAAIMASMGNEAPADGLVIRSIRRPSGNRWKN